MKWLLLCIPVGLGLAFLHADPVVVFLVSALAIIPLAQYLGDVTEDLASYLGSATGGLLIASMGTFPDLVIGIFALRHGLINVGSLPNCVERWSCRGLIQEGVSRQIG